ncbi:MAG: hypothetical protein AAGE01_10740 [Pseudomonadota bacterium]
MNPSTADVADLAGHRAAVTRLLDCFGLRLENVAADARIPGSYWGDSEAGLIGDTLYARLDTPVHSVLHEACHWICMSPRRRSNVHTDAGGTDLEECGVCYLQIVLGDALPGLGRLRILADMDAWGYSFRLGSAGAWFETDSADAVRWLEQERLLVEGRPTFRLRTSPDPEPAHA